MARCTAPVRGHRSESARAACPACGGSGNYGYRSSYNFSSYNRVPSSTSSSSSSSSSSSRPSWSPSSSKVVYTPTEIRALTPIRQSVEKQSTVFDKRDVFLCHAWDDRKNTAKELHDHLEAVGVSVWFSEKDVALGSPLLREIDKGLVKSRVGIVLVTPALLLRLRGEGIADKELSVLLARELLVPIIHNTTYAELRDVSPLLGSRSGLSTGEDSMETIATKLSELVSVD